MEDQQTQDQQTQDQGAQVSQETPSQDSALQTPQADQPVPAEPERVGQPQETQPQETQPPAEAAVQQDQSAPDPVDQVAAQTAREQELQAQRDEHNARTGGGVDGVDGSQDSEQDQA